MNDHRCFDAILLSDLVHLLTDFRFQPVLHLPTGDDWTIGDACQGDFIAGATGSGKSSRSADLIALKLLRPGAGGLVLCVKVDEAAYWHEIAALTGREADLIHVTEKKHGFNVLNYELRRCGRGADLTSNLTNLFHQLQDLLEPGKGQKTSSDFWDRASLRCLTNMRNRLLKPLGEPAPNGHKFFSSVEVQALRENRQWLDKATKTVARYWHGKNLKRQTLLQAA